MMSRSRLLPLLGSGLPLLALTFLHAAAPEGGPAGAAVPETEPNDTQESADVLPPGETVAGAIGVSGDVDWFAIDVDGPGVLTLDVDARALGSPLDPFLTVCDPAGDCRWVPEGQGVPPYGAPVGDSWKRLRVDGAGRYTLRIQAQAHLEGEGELAYMLKATFGPLPPGEPMTCRRPASYGGQGRASAGPGSLYYLHAGGQYNSVWSVRGGGGEGTFYQSPVVPYENLPGRYRTTHSIEDVAVDPFGDVIITELDQGGGDAHYLSVIRDGIRHEVLDSARVFGVLAVDPDGDLWVSVDSTQVVEYSRAGEILSELSAGGPVEDLAFAPDSTLHLIVDGALLRLGPGGLETVLAPPDLRIIEMAFDVAGRAYLATAEPIQENVWKHDLRRLEPGGGLSDVLAFSQIHAPLFAITLGPGNPTHLTFLVEADGTPTRTLTVGNFDPVYEIVATIDFCALSEVHPDAVPDPGLRFPLPAGAIALERMARAVMGDQNALPPEGERLLDEQGNGNGALDIADLYAQWQRAVTPGTEAPSPAAAAAPGGDR